MKKGFLFFLSMAIFPYAECSANMTPFSSDYCTSYVEGTRQQPQLWKHCCLEHDLYFWAGGSLDDRKAIDLRLKSCVAATGARTQAELMYLAVSIGGTSPIRFKTKQWGHGWGERERYLSLSASETQLVIEEVEQQDFELSDQLKTSFKTQILSRLEP
jgi:hypothetical protein